MPVFVQDVTQLFTSAYQQVVATRATLGLPALQPSTLTAFQLGKEFLDQNQSPPRIVITFTRAAYDRGMVMSTSTPLGATMPQKSLFTRWLEFEAHIWGDPDQTARPSPDPTPTVPPALPNPYYDFNSALELEREFIEAMYDNAGAVFIPLGLEWVQRSDTDRYGRTAVLTFKIATPVIEEPFTILPFATSTSSGVVGQVDILAISPDGTQNQGLIISVPPP